MTHPDPLVAAFEAARVDPRRFGHRAHLRVAFCYLLDLPLEQALARYLTHLRALTVVLGAPEKLHATLTWTYLALLDDAMHRHPGLHLDALLARCPELGRDGPLLYYAPEVLASETARRRFVLPGPR